MATMDIRNRVKELRFIRAADLRPHALNWRTHPENQRAALSGVLQEVGYADALIARVDGDGELELIDGHLRQDLTPDMEVPVLVTDLSESEAKLVLATLDPLAALAQVDTSQLDELLRSVNTGSQPLADLIEQLAESSGVVAFLDDAAPPDEFPEVDESIPTEHRCPRCGYRWSGASDADVGDGNQG